MFRMRSRRQRLRLVGFVLPVVLLSTTACLATTADGGVMTPQQPGQTDSASRLPQLLSQLQGSNGAGLELLDGTQSQVLAAQEAGGKDAATSTPSGSSTVIGAVTPTPTQPRAGSTPTPRPEAATATPRPGTATPTASTTTAATTTSTSTVTPTATASATGTPTPTPIPTIPSEGGAGGTPPHE